jgi:hypothetical protein
MHVEGFWNIKLGNRHLNVLVYFGKLLEKCLQNSIGRLLFKTILVVFWAEPSKCYNGVQWFHKHSDIYYSARNIVRYKLVPAQYDVIFKDVNLMSF